MNLKQGCVHAVDMSRSLTDSHLIVPATARCSRLEVGVKLRAGSREGIVCLQRAPAALRWIKP